MAYKVGNFSIIDNAYISSKDYITEESYANIYEQNFSNILYDPINPCPRQTWELISGFVCGLLIVFSNLVCLKTLNDRNLRQHPENRYYVINLCISNIICGIALFGINIQELVAKENGSIFDVESCLKICKVWSPIYIFCIMHPHVALAALSLDIARYCHLSISYQKYNSGTKVFIAIASGWCYTFMVVLIAVVVEPNILCDKTHWELNLWFIVFPIFLMFFPAVSIVILFSLVMRRYWKNSRKLHQQLKISKNNVVGTETTKLRLVGKFVQRFSHLIIFSIVCGLLYTVVTIVEVLLETKTHQRLCVLYRIDRLFIILNSFCTPWMHCLVAKDMRSKLFRQYSSCCRDNFVVSIHQSAGRCVQTSKSSSFASNNIIRQLPSTSKQLPSN